jgi:predicted Zn-dependent protease with MMP-like domain
MNDWASRTPPSLADFETLAQDAWQRIPEGFRSLCTDIVIRIEDLCEDETVLKELDIESPFDLTGLYQGRDLAHRSVSDVHTGPNYVFLYRLPILAEWAESDETLGHLVAHVLVHEVGHHFGLSDDDIESIEEETNASEPEPRKSG